MKPLVVLGMALGMFIPVTGQNNNLAEPPQCKIRFAVYQMNSHVPGGMSPGMSKEQGKWYEKNKSTYPKICLDREKPHYLLVWSSRFSSEGNPEPTIFSGGTGGVAQTMESEYVYLSIFRAEDLERAQQDKSYQPRPVYYTQHDSWWTYRKSHHKAMEDALKFLTEAAGR